MEEEENGVDENVNAEIENEEQDFVTNEDVLPSKEPDEADYEVNEKVEAVLAKYTNEDGDFDKNEASKDLYELRKTMSDKNMLAPESTDDYEIVIDEGADLFTDEVVNETKEFLLDMGLPPAYAQQIMDRHVEVVQELAEHLTNEAAPESKFTPEYAEETLTEEWGKKFEANLNNAHKGLSRYFDGTIEDYPELANHPVFANIMANIGANMREDTATQSKRVTSSMSREEAQAMIASKDYYENPHKQRKVTEYYAQFDE